MADIKNPVITVVLPVDMRDVWGYEIRADDNTTVLKRHKLVDGFLLDYTVANNTTRNLSFYVYTFNLLGEYSTGYHLVGTIPTPSVSGEVIDENAQQLKWTGHNATYYVVEVDQTDGTMQNIVTHFSTADQSLALPEGLYYSHSWFRILPYDALGLGTPSTVIEHNASDPNATSTDCLDVRLFGAVGDGEADDTDAVQAALDAAYSGTNKIVCIPAGVICKVYARYGTDGCTGLWLGASQVCLKIKSGVTLKIDGTLKMGQIAFNGVNQAIFACTLIENDNAFVGGPSVAGVNAVNTVTEGGARDTNITITGMGTIDLSEAAADMTYSAEFGNCILAGRFCKADDLTITNLRIIEPVDIGIYVGHSKRVKIANLRCESLHARGAFTCAGFISTDFCYDSLISHNIIKDKIQDLPEGYAFGIFEAMSLRTVWSDNEITGFDTGMLIHDYGMEFVEFYVYREANSTVIANHFYSNSDSGMGLHGGYGTGTPMSGIRVIGNMFTNNGSGGPVATSGGLFATTYAAGLWYEGVKNTVIANNIFSSNYYGLANANSQYSIIGVYNNSFDRNGTDIKDIFTTNDSFGRPGTVNFINPDYDPFNQYYGSQQVGVGTANTDKTVSFDIYVT